MKLTAMRLTGCWVRWILMMVVTEPCWCRLFDKKSWVCESLHMKSAIHGDNFARTCNLLAGCLSLLFLRFCVSFYSVLLSFLVQKRKLKNQVKVTLYAQLVLLKSDRKRFAFDFGVKFDWSTVLNPIGSSRLYLMKILMVKIYV